MHDYVCVSAKLPRSAGDFVCQKYTIKSRCFSTFYQSGKGIYMCHTVKMLLVLCVYYYVFMSAVLHAFLLKV